mgnify:CR=1 FL=1
MTLCVESRPVKLGLNSTEPVLVVTQAQTCSTYELFECALCDVVNAERELMETN